MDNNKKKIKILFLDILTDDGKLRKVVNEKIHQGITYGELIRRRTVFLPTSSFKTINASNGKFPEVREFDGLIIGGSVADAIKGKEKPWMIKTYGFVRKAIQKKKPILGICGGLHFTIRALGGEVIYNPKGREFGTIKIMLNKLGRKDPLFKNIPTQFLAQSSHKCIVKSLRKNWRLLAFSNLCGTQAIAIGNHIRLVQFHPEMNKENIKGIAFMRKKELEKEGIIFNEFLNSVKETRKARLILKNFIQHFVIPLVK